MTEVDFFFIFPPHLQVCNLTVPSLCLWQPAIKKKVWNLLNMLKCVTYVIMVRV